MRQPYEPYMSYDEDNVILFVKEPQPYFGPTRKYLPISFIIILVICAAVAAYIFLFNKGQLDENQRVFFYGSNNPYLLSAYLNITLQNITNTSIPCTLLNY
jgi:hypothetical protein